MDPILDEQFIVFLRHDLTHDARPDYTERALVSCKTYQEAKRIRRHFLCASRECVIRYVGQSGGGD